MTHSKTNFGFFFELFGLDSWAKVKVYDIKYKTVVFCEGSLTLVSVIKEGFEHNKTEKLCCFVAAFVFF